MTLALLLFLGCATRRVDALESAAALQELELAAQHARIESQAAEIDALRIELEAVRAVVTGLDRRAATPAVDPQREAEAGELLKRAGEAMEALDWEAARASLATLSAEYPETRSAKSSSRLARELSVIGMPAPELEVERWFQGEADWGDAKATLIVFWEAWCPHCRRELPELQERFEKHAKAGLGVVAVTKLTRSSTDETVAEFIREHGLRFPIAKESGSLSEAFDVNGIPAAAVVKDGVIVWRGHPARLTDAWIARWVE